MSLHAARMLLLSLLLAAGNTVAQVTVQVEGLVARPGSHTLVTGARLLDAVRAAAPHHEAYLLGAAWLQHDALAAQGEAKAGLLFDLAVIERTARFHGDVPRAELAARLHAQVSALPVTGRRTAVLDPIRLELDARTNRLLGAHDRLLFPARADHISIGGAVIADCELPFTGLATPQDYLSRCLRHPEADTDWLHVIQPDGRVQRRGMAPWNRDAAIALAPGARIVVPLRTARFPNDAQDGVDGGMKRFNNDLTVFFATQPLALTAGEGAQ